MFSNLSIRYKVTAITLLTSAVVLVLASAVFVGLEVINYRRAMVQELETIADITGSNSTAAIVFDDTMAAEETLSALRAKPNIVAASIFTPDGALFAGYVADAPADGSPAPRIAEDRVQASLGPVRSASSSAYSLDWSANYLDLYGPVRFDGEVIGAIFIRSSLEQIYATIETYVWIALAVILLAVAVALLLASRLHRMVSQPILHLLGAMREVSTRQDYSLRARKYGTDELGALVDGFNTMLGQIQAHEKDLKTARQQAETASRAKSEFLTNVSHELRTPLNAIIGFSEILMSESSRALDHGSYREYAHDIHESGRRLLDVINDILDLSKVEAGRLELSEEEFDVAVLIDKCVRLLRERVEAAGVELRSEVAPGIPHLYGDERLLKQSVVNLLSNAVKFTPAGGGVSVRVDYEPTGALTIAVVDNGIGIAPKDMDEVLVPFAQTENVLTREHNGTGLGLPLAKSFVELHGGVLDLRSALGEGTEVTLRFPAERVREPSYPRAMARVAALTA